LGDPAPDEKCRDEGHGSEAMYPLVWTIGALGAWMEVEKL